MWAVLLPNLPPSVAELELAVQGAFNVLSAGRLPSLEQLRSLCLGAVWPVKVRVVGPGTKALVRRVLGTMGNAPAARLVRLEGDEGSSSTLW